MLKTEKPGWLFCVSVGCSTTPRLLSIKGISINLPTNIIRFGFGFEHYLRHLISWMISTDLYIIWIFIYWCQQHPTTAFLSFSNSTILGKWFDFSLYPTHLPQDFHILTPLRFRPSPSMWPSAHVVNTGADLLTFSRIFQFLACNEPSWPITQHLGMMNLPRGPWLKGLHVEKYDVSSILTETSHALADVDGSARGIWGKNASNTLFCWKGWSHYSHYTVENWGHCSCSSMIKSWFFHS